jgi:hypothetical protein
LKALVKHNLYQSPASRKCIIINGGDRWWDDDTEQRAASFKFKCTPFNPFKALMKHDIY